MEDIKKQLLQLEFQHKKDIVEAEKRFNERTDRIQAQLDHITKLAGISFEKFAEIDARIENAANALLPRVESK